MKQLIGFVVFCAMISCQSTIENEKMVVKKIAGNCGMCKKSIESAGTIDGVVNVKWNKDLKLATIAYDSMKTNEAEILQRIASKGYDNEMYKADSTAYKGLHECCQYDREK